MITRISGHFLRVLYALVYTGVIFLATPSEMAWWYKASFWLFAGFLFWVAQSLPPSDSIAAEEGKRWWIAFPLILLIVVRVIPFLHWGKAPLGYDTGIYLRNFERAIASHSSTPLSLVAEVLSSIGFSINSILHVFLAVVNIFLGLALYIASKAIFRNRAVALSTLFLFALSIAQYEAYIWMFYRMMLALFLCMITVALISRRSWLAIVVGGFPGALHPATFLLFGLGYGVFTLLIVVRAMRGGVSERSNVLHVCLVGVGMLFLAFAVNPSEFIGYLPYLSEHRLQLSTFNASMSNELTGFYLNFTAFRASTLFYTPFALLGLWHVLRQIKKQWKEENAIVPLFVCSFLVIVFGFIITRVVFYQRYLIILDLLIILFAAVSLAQLIQYFQDTKLGRVLLGIFIMGFSGLIIFYSWTRQPWIPPNELQELKAAAAYLEPNAYGMATDAYYTPWVYGYLTERTIAPGYFINYWSFDEWAEFWYKGTDEERVQLLTRYGQDPIYIFVGKKQAENKPMREFLKLHATQASDHIWRYQVQN